MLLCFALYVIFVFIFDSCLIISMYNVAFTHRATFKDVFLFFVSSPPGLERVTLFKYVLEEILEYYKEIKSIKDMTH